MVKYTLQSINGSPVIPMRGSLNFLSATRRNLNAYDTPTVRLFSDFNTKEFE